MTKERELQRMLITTGRKYEGIKEIPGNKGWYDKEFEKKMIAIGWQYGHEWCAYFIEMVWSEVYDPIEGLAAAMDKNFSGNSQRTFRKFEESGWETGPVPVPGAIIIWRRVSKGVDDPSKGHTGMCIEVRDDYMVTLEGNTNQAGDPDGGYVAIKHRKYEFDQKGSGLELVGFIYPKGIKPDVPFKSKAEGDKFRGWINDTRPEYAKMIDLDRSGSFFNSYITRAYQDHGPEYLTV